MRIERVEALPLRAELIEPFASARGWTRARQYVIVRVVAEDGTVGYGECWGPLAGNVEVIEQLIAPMLEGQDALAGGPLVSRLHHELRFAFHTTAPYGAISGVDTALWDLKGRLLDQPIAVLLGGAFRDRVPAYASGGHVRQTEDLDRHVDHVRAELRRDLEAGFRAFKIKIGLRGFGWHHDSDRRLVEAARDEVGDAVELMVDANGSFGLPEAMRVGRMLETCDVSWFEEPVPPRDLDGYAQLSRALDVPIAAGESWALLSTFADVVRRRAAVVLQPDVTASGGITEVRRIADLAFAHNLACHPHVWGSPISVAASLQVLAALPGEVLFEFDRSPNPIREALVSAPLEIGPDGCVPLPDGPGLGIEVDEEALVAFDVRSANRS